MIVDGKLAEIERDRFAAECFTQIDGAQARSLAIIHADAALKIGEGEVTFMVAVLRAFRSLHVIAPDLPGAVLLHHLTLKRLDAVAVLALNDHDGQ